MARPDGVIEAPLVVACDGATSLLAKEAGLHAGFTPHQLALGVRALFRLTEDEVDDRLGLSGLQGATNEFLGCTDGVRGGGFVYSQVDTLSVGVVAHLDSLTQKRIPPYDLLARFVASPWVAPLLKGARLAEYSAHLLPEGGIAMVPRLSAAGLLVAGDAAALCYTNGLTFEGMNLAMTSGKLAAETAIEALASGDVSAAASGQLRAAAPGELRDQGPQDLGARGGLHASGPAVLGLPQDGGRAHGAGLPIGRPAQAEDRPTRPGRRPRRLPLRQLVRDGIAAGRSFL